MVCGGRVSLCGGRIKFCYGVWWKGHFCVVVCGGKLSLFGGMITFCCGVKWKNSILLWCVVEGSVCVVVCGSMWFIKEIICGSTVLNQCLLLGPHVK